MEDLKRLNRLKTVKLPKIAFYQPRMQLGGLFPGSLEELTITSNRSLKQEDRDLLHDPYVSTLRKFTVTNPDNTHWVSKDRGEGFATGTDTGKAEIWAQVEKSLTAQLEQKIQKVDFERQQQGLPPLTDDQVRALISEFRDVLKRQVEQLPHPRELVQQMRSEAQTAGSSKEPSSKSSALRWSF